MEEGNKFRLRLKDLRIRYDYTQEDLANKIGLSPTAVTNYEHGRRKPKYHDLLKLSEIFGVSVDYLIGKVDTRWKDDLPLELRDVVLDFENHEWIMLIPLFRSSGLSPHEVRDVVKAVEQVKKNKQGQD